MRLILLTCAVCLLALAFGCKRSGQQSTNNSAGPAAVSNGLSADRGRARELLQKGKELYRNDQDEQAVQALQEAVKLDPELAEAHFRLGLGYEALEKAENAETEYKKAVETYKKYLEENENDPEAHYNLGQSYANLAQYSEAIRQYREATKLKDDDADMYYDLGVAYTKLAQYDAAAAAFKKSVEIDPDNYRAQDALDDAKEGIQRIRTGRKHQEDLLKKQKEDELKKAAEGGASPAPLTTKPVPASTKPFPTKPVPTRPRPSPTKKP
jgi:Flp pilus assembly protein TadD